MIAYLSGAMENAPKEGREWREDISDWLKCELNHGSLDPVVMSKETAIKENAKNYRVWKTTHPEKFKLFIQKIIYSDLTAVISESDYLICLWDENVIRGGGTHAEVTFAYWYKKPVYLVNNLNEIELSSWIEGCTDTIFESFSTLKQFLKIKYGK